MSLSRKAAFGIVAAGAAALISGGMGTANAASYYGSIAVGDLGDRWAIGVTWNYQDQGRADDEALDQCGWTNCRVQVRFVNGCGAVADRDGRLYSGTGATLAEAERNALAASGPDPNPLLVSLGSAQKSEAGIIASQCT
ncbi:DUF4189 domain-containing protein [Nocardia huaxiensis]|uniref:DUF4189 domain-containing protein n=1 Tax=Nocardia huaxiensis TaxID=2755382 RepID=A0A7D6Z3T4_9NOCA|nr:DUF4189 domain-containing protein [Nocardia huaxiensis]QLY30364.1 DUF4189 domain-containing protein [Nocardia huaxiensis]UFS95999.1 DUF4189 domain-containing protein [Nocardia huaxiensis]